MQSRLLQKPCRLLAIFALNWLVFVGSAPSACAQVESAQLTAEEILQQADRHFQQGQFPEAASWYGTFLDQYGTVAEVKAHLPKIRAHALIAAAKTGDHETALKWYQAADQQALEAPPLQLAWLVGVFQAEFGAANYEKARGLLGQIFQHPATQKEHRDEVLHLGLQSFGAEENWPEAIAFYQKHRSSFEQSEAAVRDSTKLFYLAALIHAESWEAATEALFEAGKTSPSTRLGLQMQSLSWQLAEALLQKEQWEPAAQVLLQIRPHQEILTALEQSLADLERKLPVKETTRDPISLAVMREHAELLELQKAFQSLTDFDAIVRLRLASCFQALERYREAAFVLDHMIRQMPASEVTESASASLLRLWILQERWSRAIRSAELYEKRFESFENPAHRPEILFLKGQAYQGLGHFQEAADTFAYLAEHFPDHEWSLQARFLEAHQHLHLHQEDEAIARFQKLLSEAPEPLREEVEYWLAMSHYFAQQWTEARACFETYQERGNEGVYQRDVEYRMAYTYFSEAQYELSLERLRSWLDRYPEKDALDALADEVRLTLGDALGATGELEQALATYEAIAPTTRQPSLYDDAQFKIAQVHKVQQQEDRYVSTLEHFLEARPMSPKVPEALHALGKFYRSKNQPQKAQQLFWDSLTRLGNEEEQEGLEEMMLTLLQWHSKASFKELDETLDRKLHEAILLKQERWQQRLYWFKATAHQKTQQPEAEAHLKQWEQHAKLELCSPRVLLDLAQWHRQHSRWELSKAAYDTLRKYHPKSLYKDQAWLGLAQLALAQKHDAEALQAFEKWHRYTLSAKTPSPETGLELVEGPENGVASLQWAQCCLKGSPESKAHGEKLHLAILKHKPYPPKLKAEALFGYASHLAESGESRQAIAFFEQVYVLYPAHQPFAAKSYLGRAKCLQQLELYRQAHEVYQALLSKTDPASTACHAEAKLALSSLPKLP